MGLVWEVAGIESQIMPVDTEMNIESAFTGGISCLYIIL